ncbi:MAG TPA: outer membrane beta-barrel protein [Polyangiaceae bacterium]|jgi:hypothetical protein|nr:outer membrane beta-barrel protein [Polyangiaceae bacterium]
MIALRFSSICAAMAAVLWASAASAQQDQASSDDKLLFEKGGIAGLGLVAGAKLGGGFAQPFNQLGSSFVGELEFGYNLPFLERSLGVFLSGQYNSPSTEKSGLVDEMGPKGASRVPAEYGYTLTQTQAVLTLGAIYRIPLKLPSIRPYVALGGRYYMMRTEIDGSVTPSKGEALPFGTNDETGSTFGFYGALGAEYYLGPGGILLEIQTGQASTDQFILRNTNVSTLNVAVGYRLFL